MPDVLQTVGKKSWLRIVATKILEIGWMLLKTDKDVFWKFGNTRWSTTRMCFKPPAFLFSVGNVNGELAWWNGTFGFRFVWWWPVIAGLEVCRRHFNIWHQLPCYWRTPRKTCWKSCRRGITIECTENKSPHNTSPTTVTIADAEWIDHIGSSQGIKPQVAQMHVDDGTGTNHNMRCWVSIAGRGKSFQCKQVDPLWPESFDCAETRIFWSCHIPNSMFCSRTPNHLPQWFTQYGCCISSASPISGGASSHYGLGITMAWNSPHLEWACSGLHLADWIEIMVGNVPETPLEFGAVFRNTTWASLDQEGFSLATTWAQTPWPPKIFLGYFDYKFLPLEEFTFMGGLCNWCRTLAFKPAWIFGVLQVLMYIGCSFTISPLCLKQAAQWGIQGWRWRWRRCWRPALVGISFGRLHQLLPALSVK